MQISHYPNGEMQEKGKLTDTEGTNTEKPVLSGTCVMRVPILTVNHTSPLAITKSPVAQAAAHTEESSLEPNHNGS